VFSYFRACFYVFFHDKKVNLLTAKQRQPIITSNEFANFSERCSYPINMLLQNLTVTFLSKDAFPVKC